MAPCQRNQRWQHCQLHEDSQQPVRCTSNSRLCIASTSCGNRRRFVGFCISSLELYLKLELETLPVYIATAKSSLSYASSVSAPLFLRRYNREGGRLNAIKVIARKKVPEAVKVNPEFTENNCHRLSKSLALSKMTSCSELFTCH